MTELIHWRAKQYYKYKSVLDISELRSCVKVGVAFPDLPPPSTPPPPPPGPNNPYGLCGHKATLKKKGEQELCGKSAGHPALAVQKQGEWSSHWQSSGVMWKSKWLSWAFRPNEPYGFCGRKATLNHA